MQKYAVLISPFSDYARGINSATVEPPLGLAYLSAVARQKGYACLVVDAQIRRLRPRDIIDKIDFPSALLVGVSVNVVSYRAGIELCHALRRLYPSIPIVVGGPHVSVLPAQCLVAMNADIAVVGEGERTFAQLLDYFSDRGTADLSSIQGIWYNDKGKLRSTAPRPLIDNLDDIPFPDLGELGPLNQYRSRARKRPVGVLLTSRGCPFQCSYCNKSIFGGAYRMRSIPNILDEIGRQISAFKIKQLDFLDDNLTLNREHTLELFDGIADRNWKLAINLQNGVRADCIDEEILKIMIRAGVFKVSFGVESANDEVRRRAHKNLDLDKVLSMTSLARRLGLIVIGNFMFGLPGETEETIHETLSFALRMNPHIANFMITVPLPGTALYDELKSGGSLIIDTKDGLSTGFYAPTAYYRLTSVEPARVLAGYRTAYFKFFFRPSKMADSVLSIRSLPELWWYMTAINDTLKQVVGRK
jgi:anaerobic magnesium-protoporphyrin IX monomethyl ester cyclase